MSDAPISNAKAPGTPARTMRGVPVSRIMRLARKELREILRDRRTIITLVLMPVLVYPLLSIAFQRFLVSSLHTAGEEVSRIGVESKEQGQVINRALSNGEIVLALRTSAGPDESPPQKVPRQLSDLVKEDDRLRVEFFTLDNLTKGVAEGQVDLGIRLIESENQPRLADGSPPVVCELIGRDGDHHSLRLVREVERRIAAINEFHFQTRLKELGDPGTLPALPVRKLLAAAGTSSSSLKTLVPLILVLMTITGAVYPAIDLTAGERERGTLEMLVAAPVARLELMLGKYVAVLTVALLTATANLTAMSVTILSMGLGSLVLGESGLTPAVALQVFGLMVLFAAFFSAVLLAVTSFARSFKEAQAYLIPLMMVSIAPGLLSLTPDLKLNGYLAVTPLVNIVLLARDIFAGTPVPPLLAAVTVVSTALFAAAALGLAARIFGADAILYGSQGSWSDVWRGPAQSRNEASVAGAMLCLALLFPTLFLVNNALSQMTHLSIQWQLVLRGGAQVLLFAGFPLLAAWLGRVRLSSGFGVGLTPTFTSWGAVQFGLSILGAALLGLSLWPFAFQIFAFTREIGLATLDPERVKAVEAWLVTQRSMSPVWVVLAYGFLPAISEELFFRGYLFGALRARTRAATTILASAAIFGLFHLIATDTLAVERLLPTTAIGAVLGWVRWQTRSVLPGMLLHAFHNSLLLLVAYYSKELTAWGIGQEQQDYLPWTWLLAAGFVAAIAALLIAFTNRAPAGRTDAGSVGNGVLAGEPLASPLTPHPTTNPLP